MNHHLFSRIIFVALAALVLNCSNKKQPAETEKPNILWIYLEDTSPLLSCYGSKLNPTPHIDRLAEQGIRFTRAFMPAPVCSATRSGIITGTMPTTFGLHNHHSSRTESSAIYLPDSVKTIPELFRKQGYFTLNNGKDDYNFMYDRRDLYSQDYEMHPFYGKRGARVDLASLKGREPFFVQIQLSGGKEIFSSGFKDNVEEPADREKIVLPPYLPDHPAIVEEYANHLDAIRITDRKVGEIMEKLQREELLDNTVVFFFSDHGMRLTRHKQFLYDGGIHVPLIVTWFKGQAPVEKGVVRDDLVSGIDIGTTSLALAGIPVPGYMEGRDLCAENYQPRSYVISTRDRCDFTIDRIRAVRTGDFKYIRNFMTDRPYLQPTYMDVDGVEFVKVMKELYRNNELDSIQARFVSDYRPAEELYDLNEDPHEINNLAGDPEYADLLQKHRGILDNWIKETRDQGQYPEEEEGLRLMLGIWGKHANNPEYDPLREKYPNLEDSLWELKSAGWEKPAGQY